MTLRVWCFRPHVRASRWSPTRPRTPSTSTHGSPTRNLPETTVRVNKFGLLAARLEDLEEQHAQARREECGDVRLSGKQGKAYPLA